MKKLIILALLGIVVATSAKATTDYESSAHAVNNYGDTGYCSGTALSWSINTMDGWEDGMDNISYDQIETWENLGVDGKDFVEYDNYTWGEDDDDPYGTDFAEAVYFHGHGGTGGSYGYSYPVMGDYNASETCYLRTTDHMEFGSNSSASEETNVFFSYGCSSAHYEIYDNGGYDSLNDGATSGSYTTAFKMYAGFHGNSTASSATKALMEDFVTYAWDDGIGDDWVDGLTIIRPRTPNYDTCAVAIVFGVSANIRGQFYNYSGFKDLDGVGAYYGTSYYGVENCDPNNGAPL